MDSNTARRITKFCLKLANLILGIVWGTLLFYSVLEIFINSPLGSWFLWACIGVSFLYCLMAWEGYQAAESKSRILLSSYALSMFSLLLMEILVAAHVSLHKNWEKDFPDDPTGRFDDFSSYVKSNLNMFKWSASLIFLLQVTILAMVMLRAMTLGFPSSVDYHCNHFSSNCPFLSHDVMESTFEETNDLSYQERQIWLMAANGIPPCF